MPLTNWLVNFTTAPQVAVDRHGRWAIASNALPSAASHFIAVAPCRVVDTRNAAGPYGGPAFAPSQVRTFNIPGGPCAGIPAAAAYSLNFTIVNYDTSAGQNGFITAYPTGTTRPNVSTVNFGNGSNAVANAAIVPAAAGSIDVFSSAVTNLIIDINGYMAEGVVTSFNGLSGAVSLAAGTDVTLTPSGQTLTIAVSSASANTPNTLVRRDGSGDFSAGTVTLSGNLTLPASSSTAGKLLQGGSSLLHTFGSNNVFLGLNAGNFTMTGNNNTASGSFALFANKTGNDNTASGEEALANNTDGFQNTASGSRALFANTSGTFNTAGGSFALFANTTGGNNTASGSFALFANTTGNNNTASGSAALETNDTGFQNTASGSDALFANTSGAVNTAIGAFALRDNTTGNNNTASGSFALSNNTTGSSNIAVGSGAGQSLTTGNNNIDIGNNGVAGEAATIRIGSSQTRAFLAGVRGVTTGVADGLTVLIDSGGQLGTVSSSARVKRDITGMAEQSSALMKLRPVSFLYRGDAVGIRQYGLIAEEVAEVMPELVQFSPAGEAETVRYHFLAPLLLNEIQKQQQTIEELRKEKDKQITMLEARLAALEAQSRSRNSDRQ